MVEEGDLPPIAFFLKMVQVDKGSSTISESSIAVKHLVEREIAFSSSLHPSCVCTSWTIEEDEELHQLVMQYGPNGWAALAKRMKGKTTKQCKDRWHNKLNPEIDTSPWSYAQDERLVLEHRRIGNRWATLARLFPGRTANAVKNHFRSLVRLKRRIEKNRISPDSVPTYANLLFGEYSTIDTKNGPI